MKGTKVCLECLKDYPQRSKPGTVDYVRQKFCSPRCSILFRKRSRRKQPLPEANRLEMERQGIIHQPESCTMVPSRYDD